MLLFFVLLTLTFWPLGTLLMSGFLLADPLLAVNSVANGVFRWEFLLAVPVLLSPLFVGRAFCGYVCPMGFMIELFGPRRERHPGPRARGVLRKVPLFGLVVVLVLILFGSAVFLVFDPLSLFTRSATTLVYPAVDRGLRLAGDVLYLAPPLRGGVDSVTDVLTGRLVFANGLVYRLQLVMLVMFVGILAISWIERRLWCRHLCPLGRSLGLVGRGAIFGRVVDDRACTTCGACVGRLPHGRRPRRRPLHRLLPLRSGAGVRRRLLRKAPSTGAADPASSTCTTPAAGLCSRRAAWPSWAGSSSTPAWAASSATPTSSGPRAPGASWTSWPPAPAAPSA